jgi:cytochrome c oxidase assembly protein subunit 15
MLRCFPCPLVFILRYLCGAMQINRSSRPVALWLLTGVVLIVVQIILGGITRLTGSGLSITEWKPILGTLPPMNEREWQAAFSKYKEIAQFKHLNFHFTLQDFKGIYFWEWLHRVWGRLIGVVFLIPFLVFLVQRRFRADMVKPLLILFLLGGLQGAVGWIMVQSGLNNEDLYVSHIRLAIHFMLALGLLVYTFWFALKLLVPQKQVVGHGVLKKFALIILILLVVQLAYGAFMAGLKAATVAPTWPDINGAFIPENLTVYQGRQLSASSAWVNNPIVVHVVHRNLAYLITVLIVCWTVIALRENRSRLFAKVRWWPVVFVAVQVFLGIMAVLKSYKAVPQGWGVFEWMAQLHQVVAIMLLLALVGVLYLVRLQKG